MTYGIQCEFFANVNCVHFKYSCRSKLCNIITIHIFAKAVQSVNSISCDIQAQIKLMKTYFKCFHLCYLSKSCGEEEDSHEKSSSAKVIMTGLRIVLSLSL